MQCAEHIAFTGEGQLRTGNGLLKEGRDKFPPLASPGSANGCDTCTLINVELIPEVSPMGVSRQQTRDEGDNSTWTYSGDRSLCWETRVIFIEIMVFCFQTKVVRYLTRVV